MSFMAKVNQLKNKAVDVAMNYTPIEVKVREATNPDEAWGPHGTLMSEIAQATYSYEEYPEAMNMLWKRILKDREGRNWRRIYKGLLVLAHLIRNGSSRVIDSARDHVYDLRQLERFEFLDKMGKDQGINVRQKSKDLCDLLADDERLRAERRTAKTNRKRYKGVANPNFRGYDDDDYHTGGFGGGQGGRSRYKDDDADSTDSTIRHSTQTRSRFRDDDEDDDSYVGPSQHSSSRRRDAEDGADDDFATLRKTEDKPASQADNGGLIDLLGGASTSAAPASSQAANFANFNPRAGGDDDFGAFAGADSGSAKAGNTDDFAEFASASTSSAAPAGFDLLGASSPSAPTSAPANSSADLFGAFGSAPPASAPAAVNNDPFAMMMGGSAPAAPVTSSGSGDLLAPMQSSSSASQPPASSAAPKKAAGPTVIAGVTFDLDNLTMDSKKQAQQSRAAAASNTSVFDMGGGNAAASTMSSGYGAQQMGQRGGMQQQPMMMGGMQQPMMMGGMQQQQPMMMGGMMGGMQQQPMAGMGGMGMMPQHQQQQQMMGMGMNYGGQNMYNGAAQGSVFR
ncbi:uncharacterized protein MONBRDRAFT_33107 [Monosiga brevicollis MX1]|uniref:ENTH domain-containing protein n=1 Tax=Monosiga brevicollis TaxID=81824 RepID=A9V3R3_MONBE|nr:uncharacterized protein MONBRDRAFT_33107 [Monosiga brevicollis MX1]EDQ87750.1 predicted protein [Monosiga brevicollis MX1]|eukprot:XP_001747283.1 hypothetical protein [Monosiga brevicollis MX1]